jgi:acetyltransferase EpsM
MDNSPKKSVWLYGASGHSLVIRDVLKDCEVQVAGIFDDNANRVAASDSQVRRGIKLASETFSRPEAPIHITIGSAELRRSLALELTGPFLTVIHPSALVSPSTTIGEGSAILHGAIIQAQTAIGKHVIVNTGAKIDHENVIGDYANISPSATLCGNVHVGEGTLIGCGANIIPGVRIGQWSVVGAGTVVIRDVPDNAIVVGNPGRIIGYRELS